MTTSEKIREQILSCLKKQVINPALASEYTEICKELNRRLEQIDDILDQGDEIQALQMAEIYPSVMDEADTLSFFQSREWADLCGKNEVAVAPEIEAHTINRLNGLYGKGIASTHPIFKELREAVLARDDTRALRIAKTIESLVPNDANAKGERERLQKKVFTNLVVELRKSLSSDDELKTLKLLEEAEALNLPELEEFSTEIRAARELRVQRDTKKARADILSQLPILSELESEGDWRTVSEMVARINDLRDRYSIEIDASHSSRLENAAIFSEKKRAEAVKEGEFRSALKQFLISVDDASSRTQARGTLTILEIRDLITKLNKEWQTLDSFGMPVDSSRIEEASRLIEMLRNELTRLQKNRTIAIATIAVAALVSLLVSGWWIIIQYRAGDMASELIACRESRSAASVNRLIVQAEQNSLPRFSSKLTAEIEKSKQWLEAMEKEYAASSEALAGLLKRVDSFEKDDPVRLDAEYQALLERVGHLADEEQKVLLPDMNKLEKEYSDHLAVLGASYDKTLQDSLEAFDKVTQPLQKTGLSLTEIKAIVEAQVKLVSDWKSIVHSPIKELPVSIDLKTKAETDEEKTKALLSSVEAADAELVAMDKSTSLDAFRQALGALKELDIPACGLIPNAKISFNIECTPDSLLPELLFPGTPTAYQALKQNNSSDSESRHLFPKAILPNEVTPFIQLLNDDLATDVMEISLDGGDPSRTVYSKSEVKTSLDDSEGGYSVFVGKTYDSKKDSVTTPSFSMKTYRSNTKGWEKATKFSNGVDSGASKIHRDLGLKDVVSDSMEVHISPLQLLDRMTQSEGKDPIYEAYVVQQLLAMTSTRPAAWGLQYSPSAVNLTKGVDDIVRVTIGNLPQGAWMAPAYQKLSGQLKPLFEMPRHFNEEAELNKLLAEQVVDMNVFTYAGYVGVDGKPHVMSDLAPPPSELYGIYGERELRKAACIFNLKNESEYAECVKPIPLTPLYQLKNGRENMVASAIHTLRLERFRDELILPPLFTSQTNNSSQQ